MARTKRLTAVQRRAQLIEVGRAVFAASGYAASSVEEIARAAEVSKPIIYEHFGGKEGLYAVIVDREMSAVYQRIVDAMSAGVAGVARERFERAVLAFLAYVEERPDGFRVLTRDAPMSMAGRGMGGVMSALSERVETIFEEEFIAAGRDPTAAPIYAHALVGMVTVAGQWWMDNRELPIEQVAGHIAALGWMGIRHLPPEPTPIEAGPRDEPSTG